MSGQGFSTRRKREDLGGPRRRSQQPRPIAAGHAPAAPTASNRLGGVIRCTSIASRSHSPFVLDGAVRFRSMAPRGPRASPVLKIKKERTDSLVAPSRGGFWISPIVRVRPPGLAVITGTVEARLFPGTNAQGVGIAAWTRPSHWCAGFCVCASGLPCVSRPGLGGYLGLFYVSTTANPGWPDQALCRP
jgi:hypothetical protein